MHRYRGAYTALITPFTELGTVDYQSLERIVDSQIEAGIDGLVPCGTTGESPTLSHEEHDRVIAQTVKYASGRVPVIAGTGSNATTEAIRLSQHAEDSGADAVLLVNPYYNKPTQRAIDEMTIEEAQRHSAEGQFAPGSMLPKIEALVDFVESTGNLGMITDPEHICDAMKGLSGTRIVR